MTTANPATALGLGLAVFPLAGRVPLRPDWANAGTRDPAAVAWWPPGSNIGVGCRANGVVVLDLDRHHDEQDGPRIFSDWCAEARAPWPLTLTVHTPRCGLHLYFRAPPGWWVASGTVIEGIDVRGPGRLGGGYVIGPGSVTGGRLYIAESASIAPLPDWLLPRLPARPMRAYARPRRTAV